MSDLFRDAAVGQMIRWVSGNKWLQYPEEKDPSIWQKFIDKEKSGNMAMYGQAAPPEDEEKNDDRNQNESQSPQRSGSGSSGTLRGDDREYNEMSGKPIDPEKGKNIDMVSWYGPDDPGLYLVVCSPGRLELTLCARESTKLGHAQEVFRCLSNLFVVCVHLHRLCYLHTWRRRNYRDLRCFHSRGHFGSVFVCGWIWTWTE